MIFEAYAKRLERERPLWLCFKALLYIHEHKVIRYFLLLFILLNFPIQNLNASMKDEIPISYKGRFRPFEAYSKLWLQEIYHAEQIKKNDQEAFNLNDGSAETLVWNMHFLGAEAWNDAPLIWINQAALKSELGLDPKVSRFSFNTLNKLGVKNSELKKILAIYQETTKLPLNALPDAIKNGEWHSLRILKSAHNLTKYSEKTWSELKNLYLQLEHSIQTKNTREAHIITEKFANSLMQAYEGVAGKAFTYAHGKALYYPTITQLKVEKFYIHTPLLEICIILYFLACILLLLNRSTLGIAVIILAFLLHSFILALRCYILKRPPVSNMFETVIYVPWIAVLISLGMAYLFRNRLILIAASLLTLSLLVILKITHLNSHLENVQAVLDSQFWLIIHVLMVVGSYGLFALSGVLGHFYLFNSMINNKETAVMKSQSSLILQSMYLGVALLVPGTILGGVWAAQSWGRFWDWDPKESWAFISICVYLMWIHAHRFRHIGNFGLAVGAIVGLQAISFTWYGVNYILGAGLHSYGFGSGGEVYYYLFLIAETLFIILSGLLNKKAPLSNK